MEKSNNCLVIHTNKYTGNFVRELVAYAVGILQEEQENYAKDFQKAFWNEEVGNEINSYEDYRKYIDANKEYNVMSKIFMDISNLNETDEDAKYSNEEFRKIAKSLEVKDDFKDLYEEYLDFSMQPVDDFIENTFYNIGKYYKQESSEDSLENCNCIYIQLKKPLTGNYENLLIERIKKFVDKKVYENFDISKSLEDAMKDLELIGLELVDKDNNLIKKYR